MEVVKAEIERLLKANFIQNTRYVDKNFNIVPIIKKNEKMRVCIDFTDLNATMPKMNILF